MDGNDSQKQMKDKGMAEVDVWAAEPTDSQLNEDEPVTMDDSTVEDTVKECVKNWKVAQSDTWKKTVGIFDETGWFASACRHGIILWVTDMIQSGEQRQLYLELYLKQADTNKYLQLGKMLLGNYRQAHQIIQEEGSKLNKVLAVKGITTADLDQWQSEQQEYFDSNLGKEPNSEGSLHRTAYVELLMEYAEAREKSEAKGLVFPSNIP
ncbi:hypothetical protein H1R20_g6388, partial [Candolleomyces eurysporus]